MSCAAVLLVRLAPPLPALHPGKRGGYNLAHLFSLKSKRRALCRVPLFVLLALTFSISGTVSITVKTVRPAASHRLYSD